MKKFELDRRTFLRGTGVVLGLPVLEIMMPSILRAQTATKPFIINMVWPCGLPAFYKDNEATTHYRDLSAINASAFAQAKVKDYHPYYLMQHYLNNMSPQLREASFMVGNSRHNWTTSGFGGHYGNSIGIYSGGLDTSKYKSFKEFKDSGSNGDDLMMETFDQRIARHFGLNTSNALLAGGAGSIETFANRRTVESISWKLHTDGKTTRPIHLDRDPRALFDRIAGSEVLTDRDSIIARRNILTNKGTVLDAVLGDIKKLRDRLGFEDKARLDDYLTGVRELDAKTQNELSSLESGDMDKVCGAQNSRPAEIKRWEYDGHSGGYAKELRLYQDLMTLSMECGQQHVHAISLGGSGSGLYLRDPNNVPAGMPRHYHSWHGISHWRFAGGGNESFANVSSAEVEKHVRYQRETYAEYAMTTVDYFKEWMEKLIQKKQPDGKSLFDNTFASVTSFIGDGNSHNRSGIPVLMAGTAGGRIPKHNGHNFDNGNLYGTPKGNIWLSVMQSLGINISSYGASNGTLKDFNKSQKS